jgi:hypothetical protein
VDLRWTPGLVPESRTTDRVFGAARDRLVLAPVGELCLEFLLKHFAELFDYGYTRDLETQLDRVASRTLAPGEEWWSVCARADADIDRQVALCRSYEKTPSDRDDKEWALDADYSLFFTAYGARVRRRASSEKDAKPTFYPLRAGVEIDITRMRSGGYTVSDLIDVKECSVSEDEKEHDQEPERESGVLRDLGGGRSIRLGKYGHYVFYRTPEMRKPTFTSLKKCPLRFMDCAPEELLKWIEEPRDPPASRRYSSRK